MQIDGTTNVYGLLGDPVKQSLSPAMHNAAFQEKNLNCCYIPFLVAPADLPAAAQALIPLNIKGVNVTAPHKEKILPYVDQLADEAAFLQACNTVISLEGKLKGCNTDVYGFLYLLENNLKSLKEVETTCLIGAGGAAKAVAYALAKAGVKKLYIFNRTLHRAEELAGLLNKSNLSHEMLTETFTLEKTNLLKALSFSTLVVNALSTDPFQLDLLPERGKLSGLKLAVDLRYNPPDTPFLLWGRQQGALSANGLDMLFGQGFKAFEIFTGQKAPRETMREAANQFLQRSQRS